MWSEDPALIDRIYEAGVMPELWSNLLDELLERSGGLAAILSSTDDGRMRWAGSRLAQEWMPSFVGEDWARTDPRLPAMIGRSPYPGFLTIEDLFPLAEFESSPFATQWLAPKNLLCATASLIQGLGGEQVMLAFEGFGSHEESKQARAGLDRLRPHLARAAILTSQLQLEKIKAALAALQLIDVPAAAIDLRGRLQHANDLFGALTGQSVFERRERLQFADARSDLRYQAIVESLAAGRAGASIVLRRPREAPIAMHVLPIRGSAQDIFQQSAAILILANGAARSAAPPALLQALFDLSPAEARVVSLVGRGYRPIDIAKTLSLSESTVRAHLKSAFVKTDTNRQGELAAMVSAYAPPSD